MVSLSYCRGGQGWYKCIYMGMLAPNGWMVILRRVISVVLYEDSGAHSGAPDHSSTCTQSERSILELASLHTERNI